MKFKLSLKVDKQRYGQVLPINYQYELASYIYKTISRADEDYSNWLHKNGFANDKKQFKLFTFSHFIIGEYRINGDRINILSDNIDWFISFLPPRSTEEFIKGVFAEQVFTIGDMKSKVQFRVDGVELKSEPDFSKVQTFNTLSPVCITRHLSDQNKVEYLSPEGEYAHDALFFNLKNKYKAFYGEDFKGDEHFEFQIRSQPKSKLIIIKANTEQQSRIRGYTFRYSLKADPELLRLMYFCGLGEKNSMGFGMVEEWGSGE